MIADEYAQLQCYSSPAIREFDRYFLDVNLICTIEQGFFFGGGGVVRFCIN